MKAEMFYFSNSFLAVAPRCNARESRERERERGDGGGGAGDERARARGLLLLRESTVAAKVAHRETSAHTHDSWSSLCYTGCTRVGKLGAPARGNGTAGVCVGALRERNMFCVHI